MSSASQTMSKSRGPCRFFANGMSSCTKGDDCPFEHVRTGGASKPALPPCKFFNTPGGCKRGDACRNPHVSTPPDRQRLDDEDEEHLAHIASSNTGKGVSALLGASAVSAFVDASSSDTAVDDSNVDGVDAPVGKTFAEPVMNVDGTMTVHVVGETSVVFEPGAKVVRIDTSASVASRLAINGLISAVSDDALMRCLKAQAGADTDIQLLRPHATYAFVMVENRTLAETLVRALNGQSLGVLKLSDSRNRSVLSVHITAAVGGAAVTDATAIKLSWFAPTRPCWAHFTSQNACTQAAQKCNGKDLFGRSIDTNKQPAGAGAKIYSMTLQNVLPNVSADDVSRFVKRNTRNVTPSNIVFGKPSYETDARDPNGIRAVLAILRQLDGYVDNTFSDIGGSASKRKAVVRFSSSATAAAAVEHLEANRQVTLGHQPLHAELVLSAKISMVTGVYEILTEKIQAILKRGNLQSVVYPSANLTVIKFRGAQPKIVADAKRELERLTKGDRFLDTSAGVRCVPIWSPCFRDRVALDRIGTATRTYVLVDKRSHEIRLFGDNARAIEAARSALRALIDDYTARFKIVKLTSASAVRYYSRQANRPANCKFDAVRRELVVPNSESVLEAITATMSELAVSTPSASASTKLDSDNLWQASRSDATDEPDCPICFCPVEGARIKLGCGHIYCAPCFESYIEQGNFPLACMADECHAPIAMPKLRDLVGAGFQPLMQQALDAYVVAHPDEFRFCVSADCPQVYAADGARVVRCSTCCVQICTRCHVEEHDAMTCIQYEKSKAPADNVRNHIIDEFLTTRCPRCKHAFFDFDGCFSVKCGSSGCNCSFCAWCLQDCGTDAHEHVLHCRHKAPTADSYFGTFQQFKESERKRQKRLLTEYLRGLSAAQQASALASVEADLNDLGIVIQL